MPRRSPVRLPRIQSLVRANAILEAVAIAPQGAARLADIQRATGLNKSTVHTLLETLVALGFAAQDPDTRAYRLGLRVLQLGRLAENRIDLALVARPSLIRLCQATRETVNLALPGATDALVISSLEGTYSVRATSYTGWRIYYHASALGKAMLAHFDEAHRQAIYEAAPLARLTENTITDQAALEASLDEIRTRGFSLDFEEAEIGAQAVAVALVSEGGSVHGALSVSGPAGRLPEPKMQEIAAEIRREVKLILETIGAAPGQSA
jgi:DNA-binding IclR family transcriptional regulator